jgi:eukaryotic-like serine/threonine-protein kinase
MAEPAPADTPPEEYEVEFGRIADEFAACLRRGEHPDVDDYVRRHPHIADLIREGLPLVEALSPSGTARIKRPAALPERLGEYRVLRLIGRGGMAAVYEAEQPALGRRVALKVLAGSVAGDDSAVERFRREARAAALLHHSNIVPVFGVGRDGEANFFAMQLILGRSLQEIIRASSAPRTDNPAYLEQVLGKPGAESYWRSAARIAMQVAEALAHAHERGVLHRDVKPSNVLIDDDGAAWLSDFGLAKVCGQGELTRTGELVGTLRYVPPESLTGEADARGDVYGLGLTLYELLTLRPAFAESDRGRLVWDIAHTQPPPPRLLEPRIPRDLETIVLKAIAKEPGRRYHTAAELAEDLRRFLAGEPVRARRVGLWERGVRWVKQRPAVAASLAVSAAAVVALIVGTLVYNARLGAALQDTQRQLAITHVSEAQARRNGGPVGRRFDSLESLKKAVRLFRGLGELDEQRTLELRNEAIACLTVADLKPGKKWARDAGWSVPMAFDPTLQYYVVRSAADDDPEERDVRQGQLSVRRVADDREIAPLPGFGVRCVAARFSPDSRYLAAHYDWLQRHIYVWDLARGEAVLKVPQGKYISFPSFSDDSRLVALSRPDQSIQIYELPSGTKWKVLPPGPPVDGVHFHPDGRGLAVVCGNIVQLRDVRDGKQLATFRHPGGIRTLAWRGDGKVFATGCVDHDIYLWDVSNPGQPLRILKGHSAPVFSLNFSRGGDLLLSTSWDSTTRFWDPMTGQQLLSNPGELYCQFGPDDQGLDYDWRVATGRECRTFHGPKELKWVAISPGGRLMASACADGVRLWDLAAAREGDKELATLPLGLAARAHFDAKGESLITDGSAGLQRWPIAPDPETDGLRIGPPQPLGLSARAPLLFPGYDPEIALSADGRTVAHSPNCGQVLVIALENARRKLLVESPLLRHVALSPDGRWLATGNWWGRGAKVWDARTGKPACELDLGESEKGAAWTAFSPDGKWLVTGTFAEYCFWQVGSWEKKYALPRADAGRPKGWSVFSPDAKMVALLHSVGGVRLVDPETGREFARLPAAGSPYCFTPDGSQLVTNAERDGDFQVWDLRVIRQQLAEMGLDWDLPPYPQPASTNGKPLRVKVLAAEPLPPSPELDARAYLERGVLYAQLGRYVNAWADFDRARSLNPGRAVWEEAAAGISHVIEQKPRDADAYRLRAGAYERLGQWEQAIEDYSKAIALAPQRPDFFFCRARDYLRTGQKDKAAEDLRQVMGQSPAYANGLAWALATSTDPLMQDPSLAVELAKQATERVPGNASYWNTRGTAHYRAGEWEAAIRALEESQKLEPDKLLGFNAFILAMCHHQLGDALKAKEYYDRAVRWCEENQGKLSEQQQQELKAFRAEAEALLRVPPRSPAG